MIYRIYAARGFRRPLSKQIFELLGLFKNQSTESKSFLVLIAWHSAEARFYCFGYFTVVLLSKSVSHSVILGKRLEGTIEIIWFQPPLLRAGLPPT